jgi:hypothetical protein
MQFIFRLTATLVFFAAFTACHRPYALYQRTPGEYFHTNTRPSIARQNQVIDTVSSSSNLDNQIIGDEILNASASESIDESVAGASLIVPRLSQTRFGQAQKIVQEQLDQQPRPKARSNGNPPRKTFREWLGLKPRPKLNWWQRISWKLKASFFVILIAVVFAILNINTLAIIFGIIGAVLLVSGLRKTFHVRRPWF